MESKVQIGFNPDIPTPAQRRAAKKLKRAAKEAKIIAKAGGTDELKRQVAIELLSQGFLNEALARSKRTKPAKDFYQSREWASVRYAALIRADGRCACCGASKNDGAVLHVDHIKPRSKFPELSLSLDNLQVLCDLCNVAKSNIDMTDWSSKPVDESQGADYRVYMEGERRVIQVLRDIAKHG